MARSFWGLVGVAILAAGGCGQVAEDRDASAAAVRAAGAERSLPAEDAAPPAPPGESGYTIGEAAAGAAIAAKVKSTLIALTAEQGLATGNLDVKAKANGTVTLTGTVPNEEQKKRIEKAALAIEGVRAVENALVLAP
jgi:hyperosmotically inducible protein